MLFGIEQSLLGAKVKVVMPYAHPPHRRTLDVLRGPKLELLSNLSLLRLPKHFSQENQLGCVVTRLAALMIAAHYFELDCAGIL
jgi:hypothetical protein